MANNKLLEIKNLYVKYPEGDTVLHDISLEMEPGEIVCVIGESGCGKSTLLNSILKMPGRVDIESGTILFNGDNILKYSQDKFKEIRGDGIGVIYQEPGASLDPIRKIKYQFYETLKAHKRINRKDAYKEAEVIFKRLHLSDCDRILESCPVQLSGGMNQRVAIALAMALKPDILLADEPTSALDVTVQAQIVNELLRLRDEFGTGILLVTHNIGVVAKLADQIAVMYGGKIVEFGSRNSVLNHPTHPYTRALISAIPKLDGTPPIAIPGHKAAKFTDAGCAFAPRCSFSKNFCNRKKMTPIYIDGEHWSLCNSGVEDSEIK